MQISADSAAIAAPPPLAPFSDPSDLDVIAGITQGNREMFAVIVRRYNQRLYRVGMAYLRNHALTEDAMQNAYVKAFLRLPTFQRNAAFSTWLTRIMINECLMLLRRARAAPVDNIESFPTSEPSSDDDSARDHLHREEMKTLLEHTISALPRNYRAVYLLREVQQLSVAETGAALGISEASVKVLLHRARERLKIELLKTSAGVELFTYTATHCDPMTERVMRAVRATAGVGARCGAER